MRKEQIREKNFKVAVIGLGYVGLPLSLAIIKAGYTVLGVDYNPKCVAAIWQGVSNIIDVPSEVLKEVVDAGKLKATTDYSQLSQAQVIVICVPTPLNEAKEPDLTCIIEAVEGFLPYIQKETMISLESTTYPGTTDEHIISRIEKEKQWVVGEDFYVCYSPERVDPGNKVFSVENTPKVIGGATEKCLALGQAFYESFLPQIVPVKSIREAEMTKVLENTFRCVNIALVNELTMMCERMGLDIWEVIKGASSKPFGFMPFYPGPGVGGHCIPLDPLYLSWEAKKYNYFSRFIETASDINNNMPYYVVRQMTDILGKNNKALKGSKLLLIGMSYKKDISDLRESPSLLIYELLINKGATVNFFDAYAESFLWQDTKVTRTELTEAVLQEADLVVILTDHSNMDYEWLVNQAQLVYDTRNACKNIKSDKIIKLGENTD